MPDPAQSVTAVVPVYQPDATILNRCLAAVLPQVARVIIATEGNSRLPSSTTTDPRISRIHTGRTAIGFGANVNQAAAHATTEWLLILNDDVFLNSNAVARMLDVAMSEVGIVAHLLRYPDGRIFATACARNPGDHDFHHVDQLARVTTLTTVCEVENACGASWLVRRSVFERIGGYDERYKFYSEDNHLSLCVRRAGYRILYTPHAKGWHVGHQSTRKLGDLNALIAPSVKLFHELWGPYLKWNLHRVPGNFDYEKAVESPPVQAYASGA